MYFLIKTENKKIEIVDNVFSFYHVPVIVNKYFRENDIEIFDNRLEITKSFVGKGYCAYPIKKNKWLVLDCERIPSNYLFYTYVKKIVAGYIEIVSHNLNEMPLTYVYDEDLEITLNSNIKLQ